MGDGGIWYSKVMVVQGIVGGSFLFGSSRKLSLLDLNFHRRNMQFPFLQVKGGHPMTSGGEWRYIVSRGWWCRV